MTIFVDLFKGNEDSNMHYTGKKSLQHTKPSILFKVEDSDWTDWGFSGLIAMIWWKTSGAVEYKPTGKDIRPSVFTCSVPVRCYVATAKITVILKT